RRMSDDTAQRTEPTGTTTGSPQRQPEVLAAPVLAFDLIAELERLRGEDAYERGERNARTLVHEPDFRIVLIALKKGGKLEEHRAPARISIHALDGRLQVRVPLEVVELPAGRLLALEADIPHEVEALEEGAFLLTIGWHGGRPARSQGE
ncbi:MAG: cupin domain-containing protein, partial [Chloroflexia bacterium]